MAKCCKKYFHEMLCHNVSCLACKKLSNLQNMQTTFSRKFRTIQYAVTCTCIVALATCSHNLGTTQDKVGS